jgi:hypothetical protein
LSDRTSGNPTFLRTNPRLGAHDTIFSANRKANSPTRPSHCLCRSPLRSRRKGASPQSTHVTCASLADPFADRGLALRHAVEIAHGHTPLRSPDPTTPAVAIDAPSDGGLIEGCATAAATHMTIRPARPLDGGRGVVGRSRSANCRERQAAGSGSIARDTAAVTTPRWRSRRSSSGGGLMRRATSCAAAPAVRPAVARGRRYGAPVGRTRSPDGNRSRSSR